MTIDIKLVIWMRVLYYTAVYLLFSRTLSAVKVYEKTLLCLLPFSTLSTPTKYIFHLSENPSVVNVKDSSILVEIEVYAYYTIFY